ncbi:hypothetical protein PPYR_05293 [Photinus pyralis]|nr:hypothetical protein PPYR_05293 [Photinus pyralis]
MEKYKSAKCPVCWKIFAGKIFLCARGHSVCHFCSSAILKCPTCDQEITTVRNLTLEAIIKELCPNLKPKDVCMCPSSLLCETFHGKKQDLIGHMQKCHSRDLIISAQRMGIKITKSLCYSKAEEQFFKVIYCNQKFFKLHVNVQHTMLMVYFSVRIINETIQGKFEVSSQNQIRTNRFSAPITSYKRGDPDLHRTVPVPRMLITHNIDNRAMLVVYLNLIF